MTAPQFTGSDEELADLVDAVGDAVNAQWQAPGGPKFEVLETAPFLAWRDAAVARALAGFIADAMADNRGYYEWGTRMLYPTGDLEICPAFHDGDRTGETLARARMTLAHFPNHRALIRRPVVRGEWETIEAKGDDE